MGRKEHVVLECDLTGHVGDDVENVPFGLDGESYDIDLRSDLATELREKLGRYAAAGRKVTRAPVATSATPAKRRRGADEIQQAQENREKRAKVRQWCKEHDVPCGDVGRVSADVIAMYEKWMADHPAQPVAVETETSQDEMEAAAVSSSGVPVPTFSAAS